MALFSSNTSHVIGEAGKGAIVNAAGGAKTGATYGFIAAAALPVAIAGVVMAGLAATVGVSLLAGLAVPAAAGVIFGSMGATTGAMLGGGLGGAYGVAKGVSDAHTGITMQQQMQQQQAINTAIQADAAHTYAQAAGVTAAHLQHEQKTQQPVMHTQPMHQHTHSTPIHNNAPANSNIPGMQIATGPDMYQLQGRVAQPVMQRQF